MDEDVLFVSYCKSWGRLQADRTATEREILDAGGTFEYHEDGH